LFVVHRMPADFPDPQTHWCLLANTAPLSVPRSVPIHATPFVIGRRRDADLALDCPTISSRHAEVVCLREALQVRDLGSMNGTFVNGRRIADLTPVEAGDYLQLAGIIFRLNRISGPAHHSTAITASCDQSLALVQFDKLMNQRAVIPYFQPIVRLADGRQIAYEVLARSRLFGLQNPAAMFSAAAALEQEAALSRVCRWEAVACAAGFVDPPPLFLNTHPAELADLAGLHRSLVELRSKYAQKPLVLEIHEAAVTSPRVVREVRARLDELDIRLARLLELAEVPPDYLKFDMDLTRGISVSTFAKQHILGSLVQIARDLGVATVAEGVETADEQEACLQLGFEYGQGFYFGKPAARLSGSRIRQSSEA
jgi:EAL domain-containing protein (putative c-di-GMP-specific phosphodiesterase class I)